VGEIHLWNLSARFSLYLKIRNDSDELGFSDSLTKLILLKQSISDTNVVLTSSFPVVLEEQQEVTLNYLVTPASSGGPFTTTLSIQTDQAAPFDESGQDFEFTIYYSNSVAGDFQTFQSLNYSAAELADTGISGFEADVDGDGLKNGLEYVFELNPRLSESILNESYLPVIRKELDGAGVLRYAMVFSLPDRAFSDATLYGEAKDELDSTKWEELFYLESGESEPKGSADLQLQAAEDGRVQWIVFDPASPESPDQRFYRVRVELNSDL
jgi:hypothetical protein